MGEEDDLARLWRWFAEHAFRGYSPLYERIAESVAGDAAILSLQRAAPPDAHLPPLLLDAVHYLLLGGLDHPLAEVYAGSSTADPAPLFSDVCRAHRSELLSLLENRRIQTNDCGRSALVVPGLAWAADRMDRPTALVDVGASAGLNLIADRYRIDYGGHGSTGPPDSPVVISCEVVGGSPPIPPTVPPFSVRLGLDRSPVDLGDPDDARWLLACVWPDTGRLERTAASIRLAQESLPVVETGDAIADLPGLLDRIGEGLGTVVVNTWSFSYLDTAARQRYFDGLAELSRRRPLVWLLADDRSAVADVPGLADGLPPAESPPSAEPPVGAGTPPPAESDRRSGPGLDNLLAAIVFDRGAADAQVLAAVHQHGHWIDWRAG